MLAGYNNRDNAKNPITRRSPRTSSDRNLVNILLHTTFVRDRCINKVVVTVERQEISDFKVLPGPDAV